MNRTRMTIRMSLGGILALALSPCLLVLLFSPAAEPSSVGSDLAYAENVLRKAGTDTDGPGLLAFIRAKTLSEEQRRGLANKVRALGSSEYPEREKASRKEINKQMLSGRPYVARSNGLNHSFLS